MTAENREEATSDVSVSMHVSHGPHVPVVAGGWWLAAAHGGVVLAARQSTVLSNRWELDLALWRSEQPYHAPRPLATRSRSRAAFGGGFKAPTQSRELICCGARTYGVRSAGVATESAPRTTPEMRASCS